MPKKEIVEFDTSNSIEEYDDDLMKKIYKTKLLNELKKGDKIIINSFYEEKYGFKLKDENSNYYYSNTQCTRFLNNIIDYNNNLNDKDKFISLKVNDDKKQYKLKKQLIIIVQDKKEFENNNYSVLEFHFKKQK